MLCKVAQEGEAYPQTFEIHLECPVGDQPLLVAGLQRYSKNRIIDDGLLSAAIVTATLRASRGGTRLRQLQRRRQGDVFFLRF